MKFSTVAATTLAASSSALAAQTVITATNDGVVYTKTIELADTDATLAPGEYLTSIVVTRGDTVYTKVLTESSAVAETTTAAETTAAAAEEEASTTEYETVTLTLSKNGHWFTKTVTQAVGYVWTGEATTYTGVAPWATSSAAAEEETSTTEYETATLTLSKNGHWFTKTVTQPVGYVWTGEATTYTGVAPWATSSAAAEEETSTAAAAEDEASTTEYETKTLTLSKNGHWFTKTVTQPVGYVWTGEATTYTGVAPWATSSAADDEITSSGFNNSTDVTETVTDKSSTTATITSCEDDSCHKTTEQETSSTVINTEEASSTVITTVIEGVTVVTTVPCTTTSTVECTEEQCQQTSTKAPVNPTTEVPTTEVSTTEAPAKTSSGIVTVSSSSAETAQPSVTVSTYTGAAAMASVGTGLFAAAVGAMLL